MGPVRAQDIPSDAALPPLDPETPLTDLPDIGVAWPEIEAGPLDADTAAVEAADAERRYSVSVEGLTIADRAEFMLRFDSLSALVAGERAPANLAQINRRVQEDTKLLEQLLRAEGHYDPMIDTRVDAVENGARVAIVFEVEPGPLYRFSDVAVEGLDGKGDAEAALRGAFPVDAKDPVDADDIVVARSELETTIGKSGYPFAKIGEPEIVVDHDTRQATLVMKVETGGKQAFADIVVKGDRPPFDADHVARIARFKRGEPYDADRMQDLRRAIVATGLVSSVALEPVPGATPGTVDLAVTMEPAPMRTIAGDIGYGTGEGFRAEASWTHRNLIRPEGAVTFRGVAGTREQSLSATLRQGNFRTRDQVLNARLAVSNETLSAYQARAIQLSGSIERQTNIIWQKKWTWSAGFELTATEERDIRLRIFRRRTFLIGALPATLNYDGSNDLLDPTSGFRIGARLSPEISQDQGIVGYARVQLDASGYLPVNDKVTVAGRVRLGSIPGTALTRIAPSRRFYSGGGGSVRGFGYQAIGPRDTLGDPTGGRSVAEFALEARVRLGLFGGAFSVVPFLDGGNVYGATLPKFSGLRFGAGLGVRYHTSFGPIRVDLGTPINPRAGDPRITVAVSLGQAF
jgi:translocation and assembly module TamA